MEMFIVKRLYANSSTDPENKVMELKTVIIITP